MVCASQSAIARVRAMSLCAGVSTSTPPLRLVTHRLINYIRRRGSLAGTLTMWHPEPTGRGGRLLNKPPAQPTADIQRLCRITSSSSRTTEIVQPERETSVPCENSQWKSGRDSKRVPSFKKENGPKLAIFGPLISSQCACSSGQKTAFMVEASIYQVSAQDAMNILQNRDASATSFEDIHGTKTRN